ncbi:hypothetical protein BV898_19337 [Hypsibius exemplaris]|uniref:Uncharacterized protein n=1 Tax=Hypsibius exemplaris TaxID=2072580 RepID=A0A9X6RPI0_HYPEX|nr:hypothetical protein BV898_19337 [Hypsibius exemplaris]
MYHVGKPVKYVRRLKQPCKKEEDFWQRRQCKRRATFSQALSREVEDDWDCHENVNEATIDEPVEILNTVARRTNVLFYICWGFSSQMTKAPEDWKSASVLGLTEQWRSDELEEVLESFCSLAFRVW